MRCSSVRLFRHGLKDLQLVRSASGSASKHASKHVEVSEGNAKGSNFIRACHASSGIHSVPCDLTESAGGTDTGMSPKQLLMSALGSCIVMTIRTFFENSRAQASKSATTSGWASATLDSINVAVTEQGDHPHVPSSITLNIALQGTLTSEQRARLARAAENCPVKKIITGSTRIETILSA